MIRRKMLTKKERDIVMIKTSWLPDDTHISLRNFCIEHNITSTTSFPRCAVCSARAAWKRTTYEFRVFCSLACKTSEAGQAHISRSRSTSMVAKYGVENPSQVKAVQDKRKRTFEERFEGGHPLKDPKVMSKVIATNQKKYGVDYSFQAEEVKDNIKKTLIRRYGADHPSKVLSIQEKKTLSCMTKYGVTNTCVLEEVKSKARATNMERYGVPYHSMLEEVKGKISKNRKYSYYPTFVRKLSLKGITVLSSRGDYRDHDKFTFKCNSCSTTFSKDKTNPQHIFCPSNVHKCTSRYEDDVVEMVRSITDKVITRNIRFHYEGNKWHELDIYIPDLELGIEFHGLYWHSDLYKESKAHQDKYLFFKGKGIRVIQIFENEWLNTPVIIRSIIKGALNTPQDRVYARKCECKEVPTNEYKEFLELNHLQGYATASNIIGLYYRGELIALQSYSKPRFGGSYQAGTYEMVRFCTKVDTIVVGGFSKLLTAFRRSLKPNIIESFVDLRYFTGKGYGVNGFVQKRMTKPNYSYFKSGSYVLHNRMRFQKHKLEDELEVFDSSKTEYENMLDNGYLRIFDAGNILMRLECS